MTDTHAADDWILPLIAVIFFVALGYGAWILVASLTRSQEEAQCRKIAWLVQSESDLKTARAVFEACMRENKR